MSGTGDKAGDKFKVVVLGGGGVGKSAVSVRFVKGNFLELYNPTIEESYRKQLEVDSLPCFVDLMDTAGQEEYSTLRDAYLKAGHGFVLVYDITAPKSFEVAGQLYQRLLRLKEDAPEPPTVVLIGNKLDLEAKRKIPTDKAKAWAESHKMIFFETSAKENINIAETFSSLVRGMRKWRERNPRGSPSPRRVPPSASAPASSSGGSQEGWPEPPPSRERKQSADCVLQ